MKVPLDSKEADSGADTQANDDSQVLPIQLQNAKLQDDKTPVGDGWMKLDELFQYHRRAAEFKDLVDWGELINACSEIRNGMTCELGDYFAAGNTNLMRQVIFRDGELWVARLRHSCRGMPLNIDSAVETEVAALRFLKSQTSIPVPKVYGYSAVAGNPVRAEYILLEYIHGFRENYMNGCKTCPQHLESYETCTHDRHLTRQLAAIQAELAAIRFNRIGCIKDTGFDTPRFRIGREPHIGGGPWESSLEFFSDVVKEARDAFGWMNELEREVIERDGSRALPNVCMDLITKFREKKLQYGPFGLALRGFGAHKVIVDEDCNIVALTDVSGLMAAPIEVQALFPAFTELDYEPPSLDRVKTAKRFRCSPLSLRLQAYVKALRDCEDTTDNRRELDVRPSDWMTAPSTVAYLALLRCGSEIDPYEIQYWMEYCLRQYYDL